jgi:hypothetical protein
MPSGRRYSSYLVVRISGYRICGERGKGWILHHIVSSDSLCDVLDYTADDEVGLGMMVKGVPLCLDGLKGECEYQNFAFIDP